MNKNKWSVRPTLGPCADIAKNHIATFEEAYAFVEKHPEWGYETSEGASFTATATTFKKGKRKGERVIKFKTKRSEATVCEKCWGHVTNCNGTHIDMYTIEIWNYKNFGSPYKEDRES